jgi:hypothetical protein
MCEGIASSRAGGPSEITQGHFSGRRCYFGEPDLRAASFRARGHGIRNPFTQGQAERARATRGGSGTQGETI